MDNRALLLERALALFAARGYDGVGVQEIADAAGVTKPTLYHYFGSKGGLLRALLAEHALRVGPLLRAAAEYRGDLTGSLRRTAETLFRYAEAHPDWYRLQLALWYAPRESEAWRAVADFDLEQHRVVEGLFLAATGDHGNMRGRHSIYAATFFGLVHTLIGLYLNGYVTLDEALVRRALHQFEHGIYS